MTSREVSRYAFSSCVAAAILAGCGGSQPPIGAPGAQPQASALATHAERGKSWMLHEAASEDLIYAPGECGGTCVLSYPDLKQVGALGTGAAAICSDAQGNVFLSAQSTVTEYPHGGTAPIATLTVPGDEARGCSVHPTTNNLAVIFNGNGSIAVFDNETGTPTVYYSGLEAGNCGYDNAGNLFISGYNLGKPAISELPRGQQTATTLSVDGKLGNPGQIQWDGSEMTYQNNTDGSPLSIAQLSISGSTATIVGRTPLKGRMNYGAASWIYHGGVLLPYGKKDDNVNKLSLYPYPQGGKPRETFKAPRAYGHSFAGVTVSIAAVVKELK